MAGALVAGFRRTGTRGRRSGERGETVERRLLRLQGRQRFLKHEKLVENSIAFGFHGLGDLVDSSLERFLLSIERVDLIEERAHGGVGVALDDFADLRRGADIRRAEEVFDGRRIGGNLRAKLALIDGKLTAGERDAELAKRAKCVAAVAVPLGHERQQRTLQADRRLISLQNCRGVGGRVKLRLLGKRIADGVEALHKRSHGIDDCIGALFDVNRYG